jgi:hypothetical protein
MLTKLTAAASRAREAAITSNLHFATEDSCRARLCLKRARLSRARLVASVGYQPYTFNKFHCKALKRNNWVNEQIRQYRSIRRLNDIQYDQQWRLLVNMVMNHRLS